jgi:subtilisin family serine protease
MPGEVEFQGLVARSRVSTRSAHLRSGQWDTPVRVCSSPQWTPALQATTRLSPVAGVDSIRLIQTIPEWAWFDPITNTTFPQEFGFGAGHGTHTMGTVLGGAPGDQIGVAPGAQWIHAGVIDRGGINNTIANAILSFQWMAAPRATLATHGPCRASLPTRGEPSPLTATPPVMKPSGSGSTTAKQRERSSSSRPATKAPAVFDARPTAPVPGQPSDYHSVAVGAIDPYNPNWPIASFSSRGPTNCTPRRLRVHQAQHLRPGRNIRSAHIRTADTRSLSGTSMASPHVNGVVALMLEACDSLTNDEIKQIIYDTAYDLGTPGKNNTYGWGMIDAYEAVNMAIAQCTIGMQLPDGAPSMLDPGKSESFLVQVTEGSENVVPGSEVLSTVTTAAHTTACH